MGEVSETMTKKKKKGRPSLLDLQKRSLKEQQQQFHQQDNLNSINSRRNPVPEQGIAADDDEDERKQKKHKLLVGLDSHHQSRTLTANSLSFNSIPYSVDSNENVDDPEATHKRQKINVAYPGSDETSEKVPKATDSKHGSQEDSGPTTPLPDKKLLLFILDRLQKKDTHGVFSEPVDPEELPDYHDIIQHPMDFGTVRKKLDGEVYSNFEEFEKDVLLICSNAMQYNASDTIYYRQARAMQEMAKKDFANLRQDSDDSEPQPKVVRRGRPPGKSTRKVLGMTPERVAPESSSDATLASGGDNIMGSNSYNLRNGLGNFKSPDLSVRAMNHLCLRQLGKNSSNFLRSPAGSSNSKIFDHFVCMGFTEEMVSKAIQEVGEENGDLILETLLTYQHLETSPQEEPQIKSEPSSSEYELLETSQNEQKIKPEPSSVEYEQLETSHEKGLQIKSEPSSSEYGENFLDDFSDIDSFSDNEEITESVSRNDDKLLSLVNMGFEVEVASVALKRCGPDALLEELIDFIGAAELARDIDAQLPPEEKCSGQAEQKKRSYYKYEVLGRKKPRVYEKKILIEDTETIRLPNPMIGFGAPNESFSITHRALPEAAIGPPYFYYENVALAPKGVWDTISRFLYDVEPEFVDSKYFCAAARKRGYVHNLPIKDRFPLLPLPPCTIHEVFPLTRKWWPSWDPRTQLNCLQTCIASAKLTERIRKALEKYDGEPPLHVQKYILDECRKWNLVWVGRNKVAPLETDEVEMLLGFPRNHTRGGGISRTDRYKSLGNSFQVDTVAYHLSVLKELYPNGINLLSLFSGIGGAEVALHRLGIRLNNVVSVEISEVNRNIVRSWWEQTNQKGNLIDLVDVQTLTEDRLEQLMSTFGSFDLVIGGSPCNNLTGSNRYSRDGLEGKESSLFYDYFRILDSVKRIMTNMNDFV